MLQELGSRGQHAKKKLLSEAENAKSFQVDAKLETRGNALAGVLGGHAVGSPKVVVVLSELRASHLSTRKGKPKGARKQKEAHKKMHGNRLISLLSLVTAMGCAIHFHFIICFIGCIERGGRG